MSNTEPALIRYADTGLYALPSVHHDLVWADLLNTACARHAFGAIVVELPRNIDPIAFADAVAAIWPNPGVAIANAGPEEPCSWARATDAAVEPRSVSRAYAVPISPCDSIIAAVRRWWLMRRAGQDVTLEFVDLPVETGGMTARAGARLADTWLVARKGLRVYLEMHASQLEVSRQPEDDARELAMAGRLWRHIEPRALDSRKEVLFVCGMSHWPRISAILDAGPRAPHGSESISRRTTPLQTFCLSAAQAWWLGWMGIPAIAAEFVTHTAADSQTPFDLPAAAVRLKEAALAEAQTTEGQAMSPREVSGFERYLASRLALAGRWTPQLDGDLCHAAESTVSESWASTLKSVALRYPFERPTPACATGQIVQYEGTSYLVAGERAYALEGQRAFGEVFEKRTLPGVPGSLTRAEQLAAQALPVIRSAPTEDALQLAMIRYAWELAGHFGDPRHGPTSRTRSTRFSGDLGQGIDWRRTVREWARGAEETEFYVKVSSRHGRASRPRTRQRKPLGGPTPCPVAWILSPTALIEHRAAANILHAYSSFYFIREVSRLPGRIGREAVAYSVNLLRGRSGWTEQASRELLASLPSGQIARTLPWRDSDLKRFAGPSLAIATAIKYAGDKAVVVADESFRFGPDVEGFARRRGVTLVKLVWSQFGDDRARRRFALQHICPSAGYFVDPPPYIMNMIPPVPAFNPPRGEGL